MIVAFPGETEEEFVQSLAFIRQCDFADMHIFPYSRRPGTKADQMPGQLNNAIKEERSRRAITVAQQMNLAYRSAMLGTEQMVLFEEDQEGLCIGHTPNYVKVYVKNTGLHNQILKISIKDVYQDGVMGEIAI
jgi:threonylcarbamoyladenosine tRNA methylthiotransferase MtaB